jgi:ribosomal protein L11 methyltransferase
MKWLEIKVIFESTRPQVTADLISHVFHDRGVQGVIIEDPDLTPDESWGKDALRATQRAVIGFMPDNEHAPKRCRELSAHLKQMADAQGDNIRTRYRLIDEEDWSHSWKEFFWPERITDRIVVKPTWRAYSPQDRDITIEIDPGMAFGTGAHPTTAMTIQLIEKYLRKGNSFLDIGTGSGILMIAAAKLGATPVWGIDNDSLAVKIAEQNLRLNGIEDPAARVIQGDLAKDLTRSFEMVAANILSEVIIDLLDDLGQVLSHQGFFICSGIVTQHQRAVINKIHRRHLRIVEQITHEDWVAIAAQQI